MDVALAVGAIVLAWSLSEPARDFHAEHQAFHAIALRCAEGGGCPWVGPWLAGSHAHLGPAYYYFLAACQHITLDPTLPFALTIAAHGAAVFVLSRTLNRVVGRPWGWLAGALLAVDFTAIAVYADAQHAAICTLPLVVAAAGTVRWARGDSRGFVWAVAALALATQGHAITVVGVGGLALVAIWVRPTLTPLHGIAAAAAWFGAYATWLTYYVQQGRLPDPSGALSQHLLAAGGPGPGLAALIGQSPWVIALSLVVTGVAAVGVRARGLSAVARATLSLALMPVVVLAVFHAQWADRYSIVFVPVVAVLIAVGGAVAVACSVRYRRRSAGRALWTAAAAVLVGGAVMGAAEQWTRQSGPMGTAGPSLADQVAVVEALNARGVPVAYRESRVHGPAWAASGLPYLSRWLEPSSEARSTEPAHAVVLTGCSQIPATFSEAVQPLPSGARLAFYGPRIAIDGVSVSATDGAPRWSGAIRLPLGTWDRGPRADGYIAALDPRYRPAEPSAFWVATESPGPQVLAVDVALSAGEPDRDLVVVTDVRTAAMVVIDTVPVVPTRSEIGDFGLETSRYTLSAATHAAGASLRVLLTRDGAGPLHLEVYEWPRCETAAGAAEAP